jgi:hypothetical protein
MCTSPFHILAGLSERTGLPSRQTGLQVENVALLHLIPKDNTKGHRPWSNWKILGSPPTTPKPPTSPTQARLSDGIRQTGLCSTSKSKSTRLPRLFNEIQYQIYLSQLKHQVSVVIYAPEAHFPMNILAVKIKPKPVCLMPSDKRACVQLR